ncbi:MAG: VTT domain-containing protein [Eubacteriales bacterium]|nr:VTT domain-containing protein [Eubacteriales bacterium]
MNDKKRNFIMWTARLLPLLGLAVGLGWLLLSGRSLTVDEILDYTPAQPLLAALFLWLAFALKSLSMVFPVLLLFAVSGQLFPLPVALAVNTVGIAITLTLPYLLGRASELDFSEKLIARYPKLRELRRVRETSGFFLSFIARAVGILACDVVSLYFGATRLPYPAYIAGGVLGFMPDLICATILGQQIENWDSPAFWITLAVNILACVSAVFLYRWYRRRAGIA